MINNIHRTLYSNEQGNFGIDHTNPTHLLTIGNTETVTVPILITSKADAQIHLVSPDTWTGIKFNDVATGADFLWHHGENGGVFTMGGGGATGTNRKLHVHGGVTIGEGFQGETTISASNSLFVQNRVGIGTTTPAHPLHVHNNSSGSSRIRLQNTEGEWDWAVDQQDMYFATGSSIPFYINSSGHVGIGTTSIGAQLHVNQNINGINSGLLISNYNTTAGTAQQTRLLFGLARNSGSLKSTAGEIRLGKERDWTNDAVSYTHLTLPTNREV